MSERARISRDLMREVGLRFSVELGRARMPVALAVNQPAGAIVDLDHGAEDPVDLYVNGRHLGTGRLLVVDGDWAVQIETIDDLAQPSRSDQETAA